MLYNLIATKNQQIKFKNLFVDGTKIEAYANKYTFVWKSAVEKNLTEAFRELFLRHIPLKRMGTPGEIAEAVVYFASDESVYTTGQILTVSGGFGLATPVYGDLSDKTSRR